MHQPTMVFPRMISSRKVNDESQPSLEKISMEGEKIRLEPTQPLRANSGRMFCGKLSDSNLQAFCDQELKTSKATDSAQQQFNTKPNNSPIDEPVTELLSNQHASLQHSNKYQCQQQACEMKTQSRINQDEFDPCQRIWSPPGALFVPWGPAGPPQRTQSEPSWSQRGPTRISDLEFAPNNNNDDGYIKWKCSMCVSTNTRYRTLCAVIVLAILVFAAVGTGIAICITKTKTQNVASNSPSTMMDDPSTSCNYLLNHKQPNVFTQCLCAGTINVIADDVAANYNKLSREGFVNDLLPSFSSTIDSCDPSNQALVWLASGTGTPSSNARTRQRYILALIYLHWNGAYWTSNQGWFSAADECTWTGISCDANGQVVKMELIHKNLNGKLGSEIALLSSLTSLSLAKNKLQGILPTELASLSNLQKLSVAFNALTGSIPSEYGSMPHLSSLVISSNFLVGSLPTQLGMLSELQELRLSNNRINGTILSELGLLQSLQSIALDNNTLTGELPTEMGLWTRVEEINLSFNSLIGSTIPSEIGMISSLTSLSLVSSGLNGTLPVELFGIRGLQTIVANANNLYGTISPHIGQLTLLSIFNVGQNYLTGTIPSEIGLCTSLEQVFIDGNQLYGTLPREIGKLPLDTLDLIGNMLTGTVPAEVCAVVTPLYCYQGFESSLRCSCCNCPGGSFS